MFFCFKKTNKHHIKQANWGCKYLCVSLVTECKCCRELHIYIYIKLLLKQHLYSLRWQNAQVKNFIQVVILSFRLIHFLKSTLVSVSFKQKSQVLFSLCPEVLKNQYLSWKLLLFNWFLNYIYLKKIHVFEQIKEAYSTWCIIICWIEIRYFFLIHKWKQY